MLVLKCNFLVANARATDIRKRVIVMHADHKGEINERTYDIVVRSCMGSSRSRCAMCFRRWICFCHPSV